jgi:lysophospholipid acyltransferase (LPLAT)-like uncharacterized protein
LLAAHHLPKLLSHLVTALARLHVKISREEEAWRRGASVRKRAGGAKQHKKFCVALWHGKLKMPVARARVSRTRE